MGKAEDESQQLLLEIQDALNDTTSESFERTTLNPVIAIGLGGFVLLNVGLLLSLPPVLMGRGAPYLPTVSKKMDKMFAPLKAHHFAASKKNKLVFADLGSGDGRVVFRAAREGLFHKSIGYEINPLLHIFSQSRRFIQAPLYFASTNFYLKDLWNVDLTKVDVVAVYGLNPIMKDLGIKMQQELQPGCVVLSNVFSIPGWRSSPTLSRDGMHIYIVPECWNKD